jgi:hypothetical protein
MRRSNDAQALAIASHQPLRASQKSGYCSASQPMPPRTNAFQRLVTLLSAALAGHARVTESAMLADRVTGESREVDVLLVSTTATYQVNLGIEVISWARPANTPWVEKMRAKHDNLPTDKLILVSESGFSEHASPSADFDYLQLWPAARLSLAGQRGWP